jgi:hypothetical protein
LGVRTVTDVSVVLAPAPAPILQVDPASVNAANRDALPLEALDELAVTKGIAIGGEHAGTEVGVPNVDPDFPFRQPTIRTGFVITPPPPKYAGGG